MIRHYVGVIFRWGVTEYVKRTLFAHDMVYKIAHVYEGGGVDPVGNGDQICRNAVNGVKILIEVFFIEAVAVEVTRAENSYAGVSSFKIFGFRRKIVSVYLLSGDLGRLILFLPLPMV